MAFVHAETSTGALSDAQTLTQIAHENEALVIVDAVTSLAGVPLLVDEWELDAVYSGSQKCLSSLPGLSPVTFAESALEKIRNRGSKVNSWFLDLNLIMGYWNNSSSGRRAYHHTAPVNALYALHESLLMVYEEGIEHAWQRHRSNHEVLVAGLESLGFSMVVDAPYRLPQLNAVKLPDGWDDARLRGELLNKHNFELGAGLGEFAGKIWRIGLMGDACREENVQTCLRLLEELKQDVERRQAA